ncbi:MAG: divalent metal cation transporter [Candidatus Moranbacteria bacterium]|nr:divalent metal cation transporter [Candidatus Moranbacteria bacterium]
MAEILHSQDKLHTISEFRREAGIPLVLAKKLIVWGEVETIRLVDGTVRVTEAEVLKIRDLVKNPRKKLSLYFKALGPGLITGASDDDPSGIGTYSAVGAMFGLSILWMAAWLLPIMLAVQEACARIGIVTNRGLAGVLQKHYRKKVVGGIVLLLIVANVINIGADLGAMAASLTMLLGINFYIAAIGFALLIVLIEIFFKYHTYARVLKWLTVSVFAYIVTGFIIHPDWLAVFKNTFVPTIKFDENYIFAMIAVFGTTITPYLFFWQTSEEVEENKIAKAQSRGEEKPAGKNIALEKNKIIRGRMAHMRTDVGTGMVLANVVFFFIIITTAQVFFQNGIFNIGSAEEAALALRPLAGNGAYLLFALGIIGTGLLAVPILAGSGAYALCEVMKWNEGLELKFSRAKGFYSIIAFSIFVGLALNFFGINPILALYYSAYINGIIALPLLVAIMVVGSDKKIMGEETNPGWVNFFGWLAVVFMGAAVILTAYLAFK